MRKMTYEQAATLNGNFKVRVTTEQSEKMQLAWINAGKQCKVDCSEYLFLYENGVMISSGSKHDFNNHRHTHEEIELIDDLPQSDFASEQELLLWLCTGNEASYKLSVFGFKDGKLQNFTAGTEVCWSTPQNLSKWQKHTPPRLIRVNGIEVPAPLKSLDGLDIVYLPNIGNPQEPIEQTPSIVIKKGHPLDICYATKEDAIKRAEAMVKYEVVE